MHDTYDEHTIDGSEYVDVLHYCLSHNFPAACTTAILGLVTGRDNDLYTLNHTFGCEHDVDALHLCLTWLAQHNHIADEHDVCHDCCELMWSQDAETVVSRRGVEVTVCEDCRSDYQTCSDCDIAHHHIHLTTVNDYEICERCLAYNYSYCDECGEYYHDDNSDEHVHGGCDCEAPHRSFEWPGLDGFPTRNGERITVTLPAGVIDDEGLRRIRRLLATDPALHEYTWCLGGLLEEVGPMWQAKRGNFTKRIGAAVYKKTSNKLAAATITEIGNLARQHSSDTAEYHVSATRELNESANFFYHSDSCWWGGYSDGRCALKNWGGFALRSFRNNGDYADEYDSPTGRVWVQPITADLAPTHDAATADAYVIYNGYGDLDGYNPARLLAHLTGKTYKKIDFYADSQYVNAGGYLVADADLCASTDEVRLRYDIHQRIDAADVTPITADRSAA